MVALGLYLAMFIAIVGSVTYYVVESPVRAKLQQNLDLRTQLLSSLITEPLSSSQGFVDSLVGFAQALRKGEGVIPLFKSMLAASDDTIVSAGIWPEPYVLDPKKSLNSYFFNKADDGKIDQLLSYNNPKNVPYQEEYWYNSVVDKEQGTISWSDVYIDPYTHVRMITASSPYYYDGTFAGVATVDLSLEELLGFIKNHAEEYNLGIILRDKLNHVLVSHNFNLVEGIYISSNQFGDFGWQVDVVNSKSRVADEVFRQVMSIEGGIVPLLLLCVMAGYYLLNRYLISPITNIAAQVNSSKAGEVIDVEYSSHDEIGHLIKTFNEKTVYLEAEKVKAQASTNAKTAFLATLSHEIRTPMNGVLGTAQILLKTPLNSEQEKHLKSLYESGDHMMTLLNEILDFSKIEQGRLDLDETRFPLDSIIGSINSVYYTLSSEKGLQFKVYSEVPSGRWYFSDKARLRQILFNLLNNAVKFTSRGFVEVYLKEVVERSNTYLSIRVRDTGIGISKEAQKRIFKPFEQAESSTTRRFGGTGLGLAIVKKIAQLMDGSVTVTSEEGIGTSFDVRLKIQPCQPGEIESLPHKKLDYSGLKVLIVEDNRTNTMIIETFMNSKGFTCKSVENGELAIQAVVAERFDLILMDNHMPVMDGVESTTAIRALIGDVSSVLVFGCTADVFKETRERMLGAGVDYIIAKPIDERELDDALFRYSNKLYQYHEVKADDLERQDLKQHDSKSKSESLPKPDLRNKDNTEELLVTLYVALEDNNLELIQFALESLRVHVEPMNNAELTEQVDKALEQVALGSPPTQDVINIITVNLPMA
ncbi:ATP-binding protein [Vibrio sp. Isolate31]|uniref:hybrid sensor histidine kinase/response regulator n=1 Tax=unclassified Vibrio TaxID=2614977 RepID=UPI001EFCB1E4|nr:MULTISPECIES: hybrid sensor histidine kinase/response regulator [unclassified Vibrio]MCG9552092.1 ATP-binding protein [Vibrio sp. Isolate32]MCG9599396.1 ATP-binding protein [Vibrio sp. Isolate31]